ncbi:MAG: HD domain-containing protein [Candidatus Kerfeldbacteria bacterium]
MDYTDKIYGPIKIDEPVIEELIASKPIQRLKNINQYGASFYRFPHLSTTRFEHSVGVYHVLRHLGAPLLEQVFGLLHDAPHTAFSHVADFVFEDASQAFHEKFLERTIFESEIPKILKKHGLSVWKLLDKQSFKLAERSAPDLCADRIDYFFRDCVTDKQLDLPDARKMLADLFVYEGDIVFRSQELAKKFATTYRGANEKLWANPLQSAAYYLLAHAMKTALEEGVITFSDIFLTDEEVYTKMKQSNNEEILRYIEEMERVVIKEDADDYDYHIKPKIRIVDPYVLTREAGRDIKKRLGELDPTFRERNESFYERLSKGYYVKIL